MTAMNDQKVALILDWADDKGWPGLLPKRSWKNFCEFHAWERGDGGFIGSQKLQVCYHALVRRTPAEREQWREQTIGELLAETKGESLGFLPSLTIYPKPLGEGRSSFLRGRLTKTLAVG